MPRLGSSVGSREREKYVEIIIIISAERRPLVDTGFPKSVPQCPVMRHPHAAGSRDLYQVISPLVDDEEIEIQNNTLNEYVIEWFP
jgi:hypothetical protein